MKWGLMGKLTQLVYNLACKPAEVVLACTRLLRAGSTGLFESRHRWEKTTRIAKLIGDGLGKISHTQHVMPMEQEEGGVCAEHQ